MRYFYNKKIGVYSLICKINSFELEINFYKDERLNMFDKTKIISLNNLKIPILPLEYVRNFYKIKYNKNDKKLKFY